MGLGAINVDMKDILSNAGSIFTGFGDLISSIGDTIRGHKVLDESKMMELQIRWGELEAKKNELQQAVMLAQSKVNEIEAASPSLFKSGWRPATGWLCVTGLAWQIFIWPIWVWMARLWHIVEPPAIEVAVLITLLIGMLGLGTLRTVEKDRGIQDKH